MSDNNTYLDLAHGVFKLFCVWPAVDFDSLAKFAQSEHNHTLTQLEYEQLRQTAGVDKERFCKLGQVIVEWALLQELSTRGYSSQEMPVLVEKCHTQVEKHLCGKYSEMLVEEWCSDFYDRLAPWAKKPLQLRLKCAEKYAELQELLK